MYLWAYFHPNMLMHPNLNILICSLKIFYVLFHWGDSLNIVILYFLYRKSYYYIILLSHLLALHISLWVLEMIQEEVFNQTVRKEHLIIPGVFFVITWKYKWMWVYTFLSLANCHFKVRWMIISTGLEVKNLKRALINYRFAFSFKIKI